MLNFFKPKKQNAVCVVGQLLNLLKVKVSDDTLSSKRKLQVVVVHIMIMLATGQEFNQNLPIKSVS